MTSIEVNAEEFARRLAAVCLEKGTRGMPRKTRDQHILLKSILLTMKDSREYSETDINGQISWWLDRVGQGMELDHVTLRRHMVDESYLVRDDDCTSYTLGAGPSEVSFAPEISELDPTQIITEAITEREQRKSQYQANRTDRQ